MREFAPELRRWLARGDAIALGIVVATRRSAPRPVGAKLAISSSGDLAGSVSGGCVESEVYAQAREVLAGAPARLLSFGIDDDVALEVGLPCGGEIDVFVVAPERTLLERMLDATERRERFVVRWVVEGARVGAASIVRDDAPATGGFFDDVIAPPPRRLLVFGAVDAAEALCAAAKLLGWQTVVADPRPKLATRTRLPSVDEILVEWPDEALARVAPDADTAVVTLTHEERFDVPALTGALASDAFYVGALGSRRTQARRREQLLDAGVPEEQLERLSGPCGLDVGAETPPEMAVSILGEILASRAGRDGGRLRQGAGRIHRAVPV